MVCNGKTANHSDVRNFIMNATQANTQVTLQIAAQDLRDVTPALVEELSIDELAVREEYSSCLTINK
jgi:hypothetical protein